MKNVLTGKRAMTMSKNRADAYGMQRLCEALGIQNSRLIGDEVSATRLTNADMLIITDTGWVDVTRFGRLLATIKRTMGENYPIVVASHQADERRAYLECNADVVVRYPCDAEQLAEAIEAAFDSANPPKQDLRVLRGKRALVACAFYDHALIGKARCRELGDTEPVACQLGDVVNQTRIGYADVIVIIDSERPAAAICALVVAIKDAVGSDFPLVVAANNVDDSAYQDMQATVVPWPCGRGTLADAIAKEIAGLATAGQT